MICSGYKDEEYRAHNDYYTKRFYPAHKALAFGRKVVAVLHHYTKSRVYVPVKDIYTGVGKPDMGAPDEVVYILKLDVSNIKTEQV